MASARKGRGAAEWQRLLDEQHESGLSQAAFCALHGFSLGSFQNWKRRLRESGQKAPSEWIPLATAEERPDSAWEIELNLGGGICLRLRRS